MGEVNFRDQPVTGFTLELDGPDEEIDRILNAVWREMDQIAIYNRTMENPIEELGFGIPHPYLGYRGWNVRGTLTVRSGV